MGTRLVFVFLVVLLWKLALQASHSHQWLAHIPCAVASCCVIQSSPQPHQLSLSLHSILVNDKVNQCALCFQLFWEKRLEGLHACDTNEESFKSLDLPQNIQGAGPNLSTENLLQSIAAALHVSSQPITGQSATKAVLMKNPSVSINTEQPLIQVSDHDVVVMMYFLPYDVVTLWMVSRLWQWRILIFGDRRAKCRQQGRGWSRPCLAYTDEHFAWRLVLWGCFFAILGKGVQIIQVLALGHLSHRFHFLSVSIWLFAESSTEFSLYFFKYCFLLIPYTNDKPYSSHLSVSGPSLNQLFDLSSGINIPLTHYHILHWFSEL